MWWCTVGAVVLCCLGKEQGDAVFYSIAGNRMLIQRVTVPYAACIQLYPTEDAHLRLETCRGK